MAWGVRKTAQGAPHMTRGARKTAGGGRKMAWGDGKTARGAPHMTRGAWKTAGGGRKMVWGDGKTAWGAPQMTQETPHAARETVNGTADAGSASPTTGPGRVKSEVPSPPCAGRERRRNLGLKIPEKSVRQLSDFR